MHMSSRGRYSWVRLPVFFAKMPTLEVVHVINTYMDLQCWCEVKQDQDSHERSTVLIPLSEGQEVQDMKEGGLT